MLSRRSFLGLAGATAGASVAGAAAWRALVDDHVQRNADIASVGPTSSSVSRSGGRVLVVVQLGGGNDGLNTLVPVDSGIYRDARPTLAVPESELVALPGEDRFALPRSLEPLSPIWEAGELAAIAGVGFPEQSRSHFQAMDTWWSATPGGGSTGWLGRWLDATSSGDADPLRAVALGSGSPALISERSSATVVLDPNGFALRAPRGVSTDELIDALVATAEPMADEPALAAAQAAIPSSFTAVERLGEAAGEDQDAERSPNTPITELLDVAAGLIAQPLGTELVVVGVSGFDTHARQDTSHPRLLADLGAGLAAFRAEIEAMGKSDDVLVVTTSEFGRRVADNGSGTDHGNAGTQFLCGRSVKSNHVVGKADLAALEDGDLPIAVDTGSLYAECLDWLGGPTDEVLGRRYERLGIVS